MQNSNALFGFDFMSLEKPNTIHLLSTVAQKQNDTKLTTTSAVDSMDIEQGNRQSTQKATVSKTTKKNEVSAYVKVITDYNNLKMNIQSIVSRLPNSSSNIALYYRINDTFIEVENPNSSTSTNPNTSPRQKIQDIRFELSRPSVYIDDTPTELNNEVSIKEKYYPRHTLINKKVYFSNIIHFKQTITDHIKSEVFLGENQASLPPKGAQYMYTSMNAFAQEYIDIINKYRNQSSDTDTNVTTFPPPKFDYIMWKNSNAQNVEIIRSDYISKVDNLIKTYNPTGNAKNFETVIEQIVNEPSVQSYLLLLLYYTNITSFKIVKKENNTSSSKKSENPEIEMFENFYKKLHEYTKSTANTNNYLDLHELSLFPNNISYNRFVIQENRINSFLKNISNTAYDDNETNPENLPVYIIENNDKNANTNNITPKPIDNISYASQRKIVCYYAIFKFKIMDILLYTGLLNIQTMDIIKPGLKECVELIKNRKVNQTIDQDFFSFVFTPIIINKFHNVKTMIKNPHYIDWYNNAFHILAGTQKLGNIQNTTLVVEDKTTHPEKNKDLSILNQNVQHLLYKFEMNMTNYAEHMYNNYYILCLVSVAGVSYRFIQFSNDSINGTINNKIDYTFKIPSVVVVSSEGESSSTRQYFQKYSLSSTSSDISKLEPEFKNMYKSQFEKVDAERAQYDKIFINLPFRHAQFIYAKYSKTDIESTQEQPNIIAEIYDKLTEIQALFTNNVFSNERHDKYKGLTHTSSIIKLNEIEILEPNVETNQSTQGGRDTNVSENKSILFFNTQTQLNPNNKTKYWNIIGDLLLKWIDIYYTYEQQNYFGLLIGLKANLYNYVYTFKKYEIIFTLKLALRLLLTNNQHKKYNVSYICSDIEQIIEYRKRPTKVNDTSSNNDGDENNNPNENNLEQKIQTVSIVSSNINDEEAYKAVDEIKLFKPDTKLPSENPSKQQINIDQKIDTLKFVHKFVDGGINDALTSIINKTSTQTNADIEAKSDEQPDEKSNEQSNKKSNEQSIKDNERIIKSLSDAINSLLNKKNNYYIPLDDNSNDDGDTPKKQKTTGDLIDDFSKVLDELYLNTFGSTSSPDGVNNTSIDKDTYNGSIRSIDLSSKTINIDDNSISSEPKEIDQTIKTSEEILNVVQKFRNNFQIFADSDDDEITRLFKLSVKAKTFVSRATMGYLDQLTENDENDMKKFKLITSMITKTPLENKTDSEKTSEVNIEKPNTEILQLLEQIDDTFIGSTDNPYTIKSNTTEASLQNITISETEANDKLKTTIELINSIKGEASTDKPNELTQSLLSKYVDRIIEDIVSTIQTKPIDNSSTEKKPSSNKSKPTAKPASVSSADINIDEIINLFKTTDHINKELNKLNDVNQKYKYDAKVNSIAGSLRKTLNNLTNTSTSTQDIKNSINTNIEYSINSAINEFLTFIEIDNNEKNILSNYYTLYLKWLLYKTECGNFTNNSTYNSENTENLDKLEQFTKLVIDIKDMQNINTQINRDKTIIKNAFIRVIQDSTISADYKKLGSDYLTKYMDNNFLKIDMPLSQPKLKKPKTEYFKNVVYEKFGLMPLLISSKLDKRPIQLNPINPETPYPDINIDIDIDTSGETKPLTIVPAPVLSYNHMIDYSKWLNKVMSQRILSTLDFYKAIPRQSKPGDNTVKVVEQLEEIMIQLDAEGLSDS